MRKNYVTFTLLLLQVGIHGGVRPTVLAAMFIFLLPLVFFLAAHARESLKGEGWAFQLTMPDIAEELLFRGVIQGLLDRGLGKQWNVMGTRIGWGLLITSFLFAVGHVVVVNFQLSISFEWDAGIGPLVAGMTAGWLREKIRSIWPIGVVHNFSNVLIPALSPVRLR